MSSEDEESDESIDMASEYEDSDESIGMTSEDGDSDSGERIDRISELPDETREFILGFLPITDAVTTSALSRKWRYTWTKATQLNIHFHDDMETVEEESEYGDYFYRVVGNVLLSHAGLIHKCVVRLNKRSFDGDLNAWVLSLSRKGIRDLTMQSGHGIVVDPDLPSSIFQCLGLSCLTLEKFVLKNSLAFKGFPNLVRLNLIYVNIHGDMLEKVVSSCPLEELLIETCDFYSNGSAYIDGKTAISSPSLRMLNIICASHRLSDCHLKYTPNIRVASFTMEPIDDFGHTMDRLTSSYFDVLGSMPKIEEFTFDCHLHKTPTSDIISENLPESLEHLKTLTLTELNVISMDKVSFIFRIIRSSPNLQNLTIHMEKAHWRWEKISTDSLETALEFLKAEGEEEIKTNIKTLSVTFEDPERMEAEIALIDNIISWCPTLGKLFIKTSLCVEECAELQLSRAVERFGQSPSKPEIICSDSMLIREFSLLRR